MHPSTTAQPPLIVLGQLFDLAGQQAHGIQMLNTGNAMALAGAEVHCVARPHSTLPVDEVLRSIYGLERHARFHVHATGYWCKGWTSIAYHRMLRRCLRESTRPVIAYMRHPRHTLALLDAAAKRASRPRIVYEFHNLDHRLSEERHDERVATIKAIETHIARRSDLLVAISKPLAEDIATCWPDHAPMCVVEDGVDTTRFMSVTRTRTAVPCRLLYCGSLYSSKGVDELVPMLSALPERFTLTVIGGTPPDRLEHLRMAADRAGVAARMRFVGAVPPVQVVQHYGEADIIVLPGGESLHAQRYTSPLKLFEAMAVGLPIVAAPTEALTSVLCDGVTACIAGGTSGAQLAQAVLAIAADPSLATRMGEQARQRANDFSWTERGRRILTAVTSQVMHFRSPAISSCEPQKQERP